MRLKDNYYPIGVAYMQVDGSIQYKLDFSKRPFGPTGSRLLTFAVDDPSHAIVMGQMPKLDQQNPQIIYDLWEAE